MELIHGKCFQVLFGLLVLVMTLCDVAVSKLLSYDLMLTEVLTFWRSILLQHYLLNFNSLGILYHSYWIIYDAKSGLNIDFDSRMFTLNGTNMNRTVITLIQHN